MKYPAYPDYRPVHSPALKQLPAHWQLKRLRFATIGIEQGWSPQCDNEVADDDRWGVMKVGCVNGDRFDPLENKALPTNLDPIPAYELKPGDVLVSRANTQELVGSAAVVPDGVRPRLLLCDKLFRIRPQAEVQARFLTYLLRTPAARYQYERDATGASGSMQNIGQDTIKNLSIPLPSTDEQAAITDFLDWRTAQIDALIAKKRALLSAIEEQRLSTISNCVTGNRSWPKRRLRTLLATLTSGSRGWAEYFADDGPLFLRITNLRRDDPSLLLDDLQRVNPPESAEGLRTCTQAGDLLVSITADLGSVAVIPNDLEPAYVSQHLALVRLEKDKVNPYWVAYSMLSSFGRQQFQAGGYGGTKVQLGLDDIKEFVLCLPPSLEEQVALVRELANELRRLKTLREQVENAISRLTEYRSALITAAVTGQIDVRNVQVKGRT